MVTIPSRRVPTHPGEILLDDFLKPMGLTERELGDAIGVAYQRVNEIVNRHRAITPSTALRLAQFFGTTSEFWLNGQMRWDLYHAQKAEQQELNRIPRFRHRIAGTGPKGM
jgi:addiction module HigA family antidote